MNIKIMCSIWFACNSLNNNTNYRTVGFVCHTHSPSSCDLKTIGGMHSSKSRKMTISQWYMWANNIYLRFHIAFFSLSGCFNCCECSAAVRSFDFHSLCLTISMVSSCSMVFLWTITLTVTLSRWTGKWAGSFVAPFELFRRENGMWWDLPHVILLIVSNSSFVCKACVCAHLQMMWFQVASSGIDAGINGQHTKKNHSWWPTQMWEISQSGVSSMTPNLHRSFSTRSIQHDSHK